MYIFGINDNVGRNKRVLLLCGYSIYIVISLNKNSNQLNIMNHMSLMYDKVTYGTNVPVIYTPYLYQHGEGT